MRIMLADRPALVLDIETDKLPNAADYLDPIEADKRLTDPVKIEINKIERAKAREERLGLDWNVGRIVALGWWTDDHGWSVTCCATEAVEADAIRHFWRHANGHTLVGFNHAEFDLPYLIQRSRFLGIAHPDLDLGKYAKYGVVDLFRLLTFNEGHYANDRACMRRTLTAFCKRFGIEVTDTLRGSDIPALVAAGQWDEIEAHCLSDLRLTVALARALRVVPNENELLDDALARIRRLEDARP